MPVTLKTLLVRYFFVVALGLAVSSAAFVAFSVRAQTSRFEALMRDKIARLVDSHRSELLGEIVLDDDETVQRHLRYVANELRVDRVVLRLEHRRLEVVADRPFPLPSAAPVSALARVFDVQGSSDTYCQMTEAAFALS